MKRHAIVVGLLFTALSLSGSARPQSLADAAKQAEADRKVEKPASRVYGNKDLKPERTPAAQPTSTTASPTPEATTAVAELSETDRAAAYRVSAKKDEGYWKQRMQKLRAVLDADGLQLAAMKARVTKLTADADEPVGLSQRIAIRSEREAAATEVARLTAAVASDRLLINTTEEEARVANVPPGWLRAGPSR